MRVKKIFIVSLFFITGCSVFQPTQRLDMTPFSDNAVTLFSEAAKISRSFQWKYCKPYTYLPEFQNAMMRATPILVVMRGVVYYSNQVVAINNSKLSDKEKNKLLAVYLSEALDKAVQNQKLDSLALNKIGTEEIMDKIRNAETYLDGVAAAGPIVNTVVHAVQNRLDELQNDIPIVLNAFDREIERDYGMARKNFVSLRQLQQDMMLSVTRLYRARLGDTAELDTLLMENNSLGQFFTSAEKVTPAQLASTESFLLEQLHQIDVMFDQLENARIEYLAKEDELSTWRLQLEEKIIVARNAITVWAQSHRNLGAGIPVPPLIDVAGIASGLVGKAKNMVIP
jgi:hypothetical protein